MDNHIDKLIEDELRVRGAMQKGEISHDSQQCPLSLRERLKRFRRALWEIFYGFTAHELHLETKKEKGQANRLFMLIVFGDLVGIPILPPYYSMRLLPHLVPHIERWKRSILRERDLMDGLGKDA